MKRRTRQSAAVGENLEEAEEVEGEEVGEADEDNCDDDTATNQQEESTDENIEDQTIADTGSASVSYNQARGEAEAEEGAQQGTQGVEEEAQGETLINQQSDDGDGVEDENANLSKDSNGEEIEGVIENPLFSPDNCPEPEPIENFTTDGNEEDLDFEPDVDENETTVKSKLRDSAAEKESPSWLENVASPGQVGGENEKNIIIDEIVISDTDDIDELGDKIDAAYPGNNTNVDEDEESDEEKRGWRSEKAKTTTSGTTSGIRKRKSPERSRRKKSPFSRSRPRRRSR